MARAARSNRLLDAIERVGNVLPEPSFLFVLGALLVMVLSAVAAGAGWTVAPLGAATGSAALLWAGSCSGRICRPLHRTGCRKERACGFRLGGAGGW